MASGPTTLASPKSSYVGFTFFVDEDVQGLEVTVDDCSQVGGCHGVADLQEGMNAFNEIRFPPGL